MVTIQFFAAQRPCTVAIASAPIGACRAFSAAGVLADGRATITAYRPGEVERRRRNSVQNISASDEPTFMPSTSRRPSAFAPTATIGAKVHHLCGRRRFLGFAIRSPNPTEKTVDGLPQAARSLPYRTARFSSGLLLRSSTTNRDTTLTSFVNSPLSPLGRNILMIS